MNPARSLSPAIATQNFHKIFIYLISPVVGTIVAVILYHISFGHQEPRRTSCIGSKRIEPVDSVINLYKAQFPQNQTSPSSDERQREMASVTVTIARKDINFTVTFDETCEITTTVTSLGADVEAWITETRDIYRRDLSHFVISIDNEWCPSSNETAWPSSVGASSTTSSMIHAAKDDGVPHALADFLFDNDFTFTYCSRRFYSSQALGSHQNAHKKEHAANRNPITTATSSYLGGSTSASRSTSPAAAWIEQPCQHQAGYIYFYGPRPSLPSFPAVPPATADPPADVDPFLNFLGWKKKPSFLFLILIYSLSIGSY